MWREVNYEKNNFVFQSIISFFFIILLVVGRIDVIIFII